MTHTSPRRICAADAQGRLLGVVDIQAAGSDGVARANVHIEAGATGQDTGRRLMDTVVDSPEVQQAERVTAVLPRGAAECLLRAQERLRLSDTREAGASVIVDGTIRGKDGRTASA